MNEVTRTYVEFKQELDKEMRAVANGFCKIGYLLRIARDTNVLAESGYENLNEFAKEEYGLTKDMVSRYIHINEKYSEGGYSDRLKTEYERYGVAKLSEMMTLPDAVAEEITPDMSKEQIQEIRREVREEEKVTDIEVALEDTVVPADTTNLEKWMYAYFEQEKAAFGRIRDVIAISLSTNLAPAHAMYIVLLDAIAPKGVAVLSARVPAVGRIMLSVKSIDEPMVLVQVRTGEKEDIAWEQFVETFTKMYQGDNTVEAWETVYQGMKYEEEPNAKPAVSIPKETETTKQTADVSKESDAADQPEVVSMESDAKQKESIPEESDVAAGRAKGSSEIDVFANEMNPPEVAPVQPEVIDAEYTEVQREIHNYPDVLPAGEKFEPVFGEWVSVEQKEMPDIPGRYIIHRVDYDRGSVLVVKNAVLSGDKMQWENFWGTMTHWMPAPPLPEGYHE